MNAIVLVIAGKPKEPRKPKVFVVFILAPWMAKI
jgi:hypothetical protein